MSKLRNGQTSWRFNTPEQIEADPALRLARKVDHAFFMANPTANEFLREMIPNEFGHGRTPTYEPPANCRFGVRVVGFLDPVSHKVLMRTRRLEVMPLNAPLQWYLDGGLRRLHS